MKVGTPLRLVERDLAAQSRGEWPGVSWTLLRELGVSIRDGAGAREERACAAEESGGPRFGMGPRGVCGARREEVAREGGGMREEGDREGGAMREEVGREGGGMRLEGARGGFEVTEGADAR